MKKTTAKTAKIKTKKSFSSKHPVSAKKIHFVGIGGTGMSAIAKILLGFGYTVSGSDLNSKGLVKRLKAQGATIYKGHRAENIKKPGLVIISSAISQDNPEVREARKQNIQPNGQFFLI